jgi:hypothetical protein
VDLWNVKHKLKHSYNGTLLRRTGRAHETNKTLYEYFIVKDGQAVRHFHGFLEAINVSGNNPTWPQQLLVIYRPSLRKGKFCFLGIF